MADLVAFLSARLDEDEAAAQAAHPAPWTIQEERGLFKIAHLAVMAPFGPNVPGATHGLTRYVPLCSDDATTAVHIARHDPARVLREVEVWRKVLRLYEFHAPGAAEEFGASLFDAAARTTLENLMRLKAAAVYSDHPDYDPAWADA